MTGYPERKKSVYLGYMGIAAAMSSCIGVFDNIPDAQVVKAGRQGVGVEPSASARERISAAAEKRERRRKRRLRLGC